MDSDVLLPRIIHSIPLPSTRRIRRGCADGSATEDKPEFVHLNISRRMGSKVLCAPALLTRRVAGLPENLTFNHSFFSFSAFIGVKPTAESAKHSEARVIPASSNKRKILGGGSGLGSSHPFSYCPTLTAGMDLPASFR